MSSSSSLITAIRSRLSNVPARERVKALLGALIGPSNQSLLPFVPRPIKLLIAFIFLLNWRSWPFVWHYRVFTSVFKIRFDAFRKARTVPARRKWLGQVSCVGGDPFELVSTISYRCGFDDMDYNGHLSNSSYAKACDAGRMKFAIELLPACFGDGAWMALGGGSYHFIREIPYGACYEVKTSIAGWDSKWMYLVHHFVTYPSKTSSKNKAGAVTKSLSSMASHNRGVAHIATPSTPSLIDSPPVPGSPKVSAARTPYRAPSTIPKWKVKTPLPEGALVHCIAVSTYCFKIGRITVPPSICFVASGLGDPAKQRWFHVQDLRFSKRYPPAAGKPEEKNRMTEIMRGGWRTHVVDGWDLNADGVCSFWDLGEYEERRAENMRGIFDLMHASWKKLRESPY